MQNWKFIFSAVQEILGGHKIGKVGHMTRATPSFDEFFIFFV